MGMDYWSTTDSATGESVRIYVDDFGTTNSWLTNRSYSTKQQVQGSITAKQKKMIKEEIKVWMDDHLKKSIEKEAGKLLKDIEYLKEEKKRLGKSISALKQEMRVTKKEVQVEIVAMEEMLKRYANQILRYQNMDL
jgi:predicted  nucleic acid-binding Zn-ribbon protein